MPRKTRESQFLLGRRQRASMRPRPDAAENREAAFIAVSRSILLQ